MVIAFMVTQIRAGYYTWLGKKSIQWALIKMPYLCMCSGVCLRLNAF